VPGNSDLFLTPQQREIAEKRREGRVDDIV
jgi:hypothetical protein